MRRSLTGLQRMAEIDSIASLCDAAAKELREASASPQRVPPALMKVAGVLDFLACDADRVCRYGHADRLSSLAQSIRATAGEIAKSHSSKGTS